MKLTLRLSSTIFLFALTTSTTSASHIPIKSGTVTEPGKLYAGVFVGGGSSNRFNASQQGTAFYTDVLGPLAVNAFGESNSKSTGFWGIQLGYQAHEILLNSLSQWRLGPAAELEGYAMSNTTFNGTLINDTTRVPEHNFEVSYPMSRTVFLANAILNFNNPCFLVHPYVGFGIGDAIVRISGADSAQVAPPEAGINHYNSSTNDSNSTFAGQIKLGLSYDINKCVSLFAEYRWLYLASTHFVFGSTVASGHVATSSWQVSLDAQRYNLGDVGIRFNL